jgi:hypothetical protein
MKHTHQKYTVRNLSIECIDRLREVRETSGVPIGRLIDDAVAQWWDTLPIGDDHAGRSPST